MAGRRAAPRSAGVHAPQSNTQPNAESDAMNWLTQTVEWIPVDAAYLIRCACVVASGFMLAIDAWLVTYYSQNRQQRAFFVAIGLLMAVVCNGQAAKAHVPVTGSTLVILLALILSVYGSWGLYRRGRVRPDSR